MSAFIGIVLGLVALTVVVLGALAIVRALYAAIRRLVAEGGAAPAATSQRHPHSGGSRVVVEVVSLRDPAIAPQQSGDKQWVPPGVPARVAGHDIPGGMIYVGRDLPAIHRWRGVEPALIDPRLPVARGRANLAGADIPYWPSYAELSPQSRAAYLAWLAGGRTDPDAYIGYVFLFFYGLERRLLHDAQVSSQTTAELDELRAEVLRLRDRYAGNRSFDRYATGLLEALAIGNDGRDWRSWEPPGGGTFDIPLSIRLAVGRMALDGVPVPEEWALAWVRCDPESRLRTPAQRCAREFDALFRTRYRERFGAGLPVKACKRTVQIEYRPASASFGGSLVLKSELPDVASLVGPRRRLQELASECCDALDGFSRWVGRNPGEREGLGAAALLPPELLAARPSEGVGRLRQTLESTVGKNPFAVSDALSVLSPWLPPDGGRMPKRSFVEAAQLLSHLGYGIEPDVRFGGPLPGGATPVVIYRLSPEGSGALTPAYSAVALLLQLAAMVSAADGSVSEAERERLQDHLIREVALDEPERRRLAAHMQWLLVSPPGLSGVQRRVAALDQAQRAACGQFLVDVACADGVVTPEEVKILGRLFRALGLNESSVHAALHSAAAEGGPSTEPVVVAAAEPRETYRVPPPPKARSAARSNAAPLAPERIAQKMAETAAVSALLASVFVEEEAPSASTTSAVFEALGGLDPRHSELLRRLGERPLWAAADFENLAQDLDLLPNGALETLNDLAFERCGTPLLEGDGPLEVDATVYQELTS